MVRVKFDPDLLRQLEQQLQTLGDINWAHHKDTELRVQGMEAAGKEFLKSITKELEKPW